MTNKKSSHHSHKSNVSSKALPQVDEKCRLILTSYDDKELKEEELANVSDLASIVAKIQNKVLWLHVIGIPDQATADEINKTFDIHQLAPLELLRTHMRSKFELFEKLVMIVAWSVTIDGGLRTHQLIILASDTFVVTVQHEETDVIDHIREKLQKSASKTRRSGTDYLAYAILNETVDTYFPCLEKYGERLETIEEQILDNPNRRSISHIHSIKRDLLAIRRQIWSLRETLNAILRDASDNLQPDTIVHFRDTYDHAVQLIDFVETYRELGADLMDVYLSSISNRMNEVMKVLTIITTIFVPPGLIAAIYGMNFRQDLSPLNMPELSWYYGYPFAICLMIVLALTTLSFFWWKGWLGDPPKLLRSLRRKAVRTTNTNVANFNATFAPYAVLHERHHHEIGEHHTHANAAESHQQDKSKSDKS